MRATDTTVRLVLGGTRGGGLGACTLLSLRWRGDAPTACYERPPQGSYSQAVPGALLPSGLDGRPDRPASLGWRARLCFTCRWAHPIAHLLLTCKRPPNDE